MYNSGDIIQLFEIRWEEQKLWNEQIEYKYNLHYANMSVQYTAIFHGCKNDNFQMKILVFFLFLLKT